MIVKVTKDLIIVIICSFIHGLELCPLITFISITVQVLFIFIMKALYILIIIRLILVACILTSYVIYLLLKRGMENINQSNNDINYYLCIEKWFRLLSGDSFYNDKKVGSIGLYEKGYLWGHWVGLNEGGVQFLGLCYL